ncbi:MAG: MarR family transcriptional regulator [Proteobacteria bacterium]|nr:MarR family transcriptional regulator [Pseudomonadota bacterium]
MQNAAATPESSFGLCRLIGQVRGEIVLGIEQALVDAGLELNFSQFLALKKLGDTGPTTPGELARALNYNPGAMTRLLDKLEQLGYLQRVPDPTDRRALQLELTPAGRDVHARMIAGGNAAAERAFSDINQDERRQLHDLLVRLLEHLRAERQRLAGS